MAEDRPPPETLFCPDLMPAEDPTYFLRYPPTGASSSTSTSSRWPLSDSAALVQTPLPATFVGRQGFGMTCCWCAFRSNYLVCLDALQLPEVAGWRGNSGSVPICVACAGSPTLSAFSHSVENPPAGGLALASEWRSLRSLELWRPLLLWTSRSGLVQVAQQQQQPGTSVGFPASRVDVSLRYAFVERSMAAVMRHVTNFTALQVPATHTLLYANYRSVCSLGSILQGCFLW